ncbi:coagulation factor XII [Carettochelys insculpta]|uniref:coagulation factor XII n=1 Tax=Carettochelys insculpta TaxID=44489 RepID=UPI003EB874D8
MMSLLLLVLLLSLGATVPHRSPKPHPRMNEEGRAAAGETCHFPFRYQRKMHYSCIRGHGARPQPWCATTENYDEHGKWTLCEEEAAGVTDPCMPNPCEKGGVCTSIQGGYHCKCPARFHGKHCQKESCFEEQLLAYFSEGEKWLRSQPPHVEECHCARGKAVCQRAHGKACRRNPCLNGGRCMEMKWEHVCSCRSGYVGRFCDIDQKQACYDGNGLLYRGTAHSTLSGAPCLPWDSHLLSHEFSSHSLQDAFIRGLGSHAFCRNPDNDTQPWCYVLRDRQLSWEFCSIPLCKPQAGRPPALGEGWGDPGVTGTFPTGAAGTEGAGGQPEAKPTSSSNHSAPACGQRYRKSLSQRSRVVGGMLALPAAHPYLAALHLGEHFCGGTLIASCWVLTAAHCLEHRPSVSQISVRLGQTHYNSSSQGSAQLRAHSYVLHENYSQATQRHDIALVRLREEAPGRCAEFSHSVLPACLPSASEPLNTSRPCEIAGWGHLYEGAGQLSEYLQEAVVPIVPQEQCRSPLLHGTRVTADMLCAGYLEGGTDACQGDSGGPLVCEAQGRATLQGIVSWGVGCGEQNKPGVYTKVAHYLAWIQEHIGSEGAAPASPK